MPESLLNEPEHNGLAVEIYAIICIDPDGNEGLCGCYMEKAGGFVPFVFNKLETIDAVRKNYMPQLKALSKPGCKFVVRKYADYTDIEEI